MLSALLMPAQPVDSQLAYCVTGSGGCAAFGAFRWGALGAAGGAADTEGGVGGAGGKPSPFLMRTSPTSAVRLILPEPEPILPLTVLL